jgi:hypothetical protein
VRAPSLDQAVAGGRRLALAGQVEQLEAGCPPLGAAGQGGQVGRGQRLAVHHLEQLLDLPRPEPEVVGPDLEQVALDPQAGEGEGGAAAGADDQSEAGRQVAEEVLQGQLGRRAVQRVEVVDHDGGTGGGVLVQGGCGVLDAGPARAEAVEGGGAGPLQVADQGGLGDVGRLGPVPGHGAAGAGGEVGEERGLARPGRRHHQGQPVVEDGAEDPVEAGSTEATGHGHAHLRPGHRRGGRTVDSGRSFHLHLSPRTVASTALLGTGTDP